MSSPTLFPNIAYDDTDNIYEDSRMVNLRLGRTVHRSYVGRRSGCSQPVIIALLLFSAFIFIIFQITNMIPRKLVPPSFAWSSSATRNLTIYVRPHQTTALLQPRSLCNQPPFVLFMVPSAINNTKERESIRRTWGQWAKSVALKTLPREDQTLHQKDSKTKKKLNVVESLNPPPRRSKLVFLLGTARGENRISDIVREEGRIFGDILVEDFVDSYTNLTLKSVFLLKWVHKNCPTAEFVMKVDDDIFVNVLNLQQTLMNKTITKTPLLTGTLICGARPIHDQWSKWYTPQYMFREGKYPNYLSGTGYVFSGDLVEPLLNAALSTPYFHLEDVFITGICAKKIGLRPTDNFGFNYQPRAVSPCVYKEVIMGHGVKPSEMVKLWNMLNQPNTVAKCHPIKKSKLRSSFPTKCSWR